MLQKVIKFFDKLEDKIRGHLSHYPIVYALLGGIGVVLFWRGVWHMADDFGIQSATSLVLGIGILLLTGVFVSAFIGNKLIISGLSGEKKLEEKQIEEIKTEEGRIHDLQSTLSRLEKKLEHIDQDVENLKK